MGREFLSPSVGLTFQSSPGRQLPLGLGGQSLTRPSRIGLGVFVFGLAVLWLSTRKPIPHAVAMAVVAADAAWVLGSWGLLVGASWLSNQGWWAVGGVADIVLLFAVLQWLGARRVQAIA